jgi:hypothetical protein
VLQTEATAAAVKEQRLPKSSYFGDDLSFTRSSVERAVLEQKLELDISDCVIERIMQEGGARADQFGARPIRRAAQRYVEDSLSEAIIQGFIQEGDAVKIQVAIKKNDNVGGPRQKDVVLVQRVKDGKLLEVEVEDADGGIGSHLEDDKTETLSSDPSKTNNNGSNIGMDELSTLASSTTAR